MITVLTLLTSKEGEPCEDCKDNTLRLWDWKSGQCLDEVSEEEVGKKRPEWLHARANATIRGRVSGDWLASSAVRYASLRHKTLPAALAIWNADSDAESPCLQADGTLVVTQANGQVCFLKLHHGHRRITLAEAEAILVERGDLPATCASVPCGGSDGGGDWHENRIAICPSDFCR